MTGVAEQISPWLEAFTALERKRSGLAGLEEVRAAAFQRFAERGFPTTHDEEWRFTNVAPIARVAYAPAPASGNLNLDELTAFASGVRLIFVNGRLVSTPEALPKGVRACSLAQAMAEDSAAVRQHLARHASSDGNAFVALNTAFLEDGAYVRVARGTLVEQPIHLIYVTAPGAQPQAAHPRALIVAEGGSEFAVVESYLCDGDGAYFSNAVTEIVAEDRAVVNHYKLQLEGPGAFHVATLQAQLGRSANFSSHSFSLGALLARNDANAVMSEGAECTLNGLYLASGEQHVDNHTVIDHAMPHGTSHELYKGILDGKASAVFNGRILVRKDAQKTDSKQTNKNLVLSEDAVINTKPELQIFADDVRCTHGATIGQLDAEALFYLQSRGIGKEEGRSLLTFAFAQDVVDRVKVQGLRERLEALLIGKFHEHAR